MLYKNNAIELEENLNRLHNIRNEFSLKINFKKTVIQKKLTETQM